jgi:hypothetical protein
MEKSGIFAVMINKTLDRELTALDRCDSCSAAAKVVAKFLNGELMFCGHHAREKESSLIAKAIEIYDPESVMLALE